MSSQNPARKDQNWINNSKLPILLKSSIWGAITAVISLPFEHPFDVIKTNMQANQSSFKKTINIIFERKGVRGFYNGFSMNLLRASLKQAYRWPLWITFGSLYKRILADKNEIFKQTVTGFSIALCELIFICPFERVKVWLMTTQNQEETRYKKYYEKHLRFRDLYTGFTALLLKQGLSWSSFLASSEVLKKKMKEYKKSETLSPGDLLLLSIPVSIINTVLIMPIDCIKTAYQQYIPSTTSESYSTTTLTENKSFFQVTKELLSKYGLKGLSYGWSARLIQYTIQSAFTLVLIEELHVMFEKASG